MSDLQLKDGQGEKKASCPAAAMGGPVSGPTLFLLPGVIRRPACGARLGPWCQPQAGTSGSFRDTYGAAGCRRTEKARQEASHAGVNLGLDSCPGLSMPEFSLRFVFKSLYLKFYVFPILK